MPPPITLLTDFGTVDGYVAQMKGAILSIAPETTIVDVTHSIPHGDVRQGALALDQIVDAFPPLTVHVAVVDPGVGSGRAILGVETCGQRFLAPDNGLLGAVLNRQRFTRIHRLKNDRFWRHPVSPTFHGRDILAPVAAHWMLGADLSEFGPMVNERGLVRLSGAAPQLNNGAWVGEVVAVDRFGNLMTNLSEAILAEYIGPEVTVSAGDIEICGVNRFYAEQPAGALLALIGSSGRLEVAVNGGSAAAKPGLGIGTVVSVRRRPRSE
ncbi:MAG: hypothetical protein EXS05_02585 [Planctomycetaceae bacterium]|nr:hypothetical protein [Planctomycetaceae bacterium]